MRGSTDQLKAETTELLKTDLYDTKQQFNTFGTAFMLSESS